MIKLFKSIEIGLTNNLQLFVLSIALSIPVVILGENLLFAVPVVIIVLMSFIFGERFIIGIVIISLFTLVGELNRSLRLVVQLVSLSVISIMFLRRYGLEFDKYRSVPKELLYVLILYFSAMVISSVMSDFPFVGIPIIIRQLVFFAFVYLFYSLINDYSDIKNYILAIIIVSFIMVTASLIFFMTEGYSLMDIAIQGRTRVSVVISNAEAITNFYVVSIPFILAFILLNTKKINKWVGLLSIMYIGLGLILTMERSAFLGIIVSGVIVFYILNRKAFYKLIISVAFLSVFIFLYEPLNEIVYLTFRIEAGMSARDDIWVMSVDMIKDHLLFGIGPGANNYVIINYFPYMLDDYWGKVLLYFAEVSEGVNLSHNILLAVFTEIGVFGFIAVITLMVIYFRIGILTIKKYKNGSAEKFYLVVALFAAGTSVIVRNYFNSLGLLYIGGIHTDLPFWLIFGSIIYFYKTPLPSKEVLGDQLKSTVL
jgi:O-antigen ligase